MNPNSEGNSRSTEDEPSKSYTATDEENHKRTNSDTAPSPPNLHPRSSPFSLESDEMKRAAAKKLIERYFYQLLEGCGNMDCNNKHCASSGEVRNLTPDQAAARALQLYSEDAKLCDIHPSKGAARTRVDGVINGEQQIAAKSNTQSKSNEGNTLNSVHPSADHQNPETSKSSQSTAEASPSNSATTSKIPLLKSTVYPSIVKIDETEITRLIGICHAEKSYSILIRTLGEVFSSRECIAASFQKTPSSSIDAMLEKAPGDLRSLKKEDLRTLEGDLDKDEDSCADKIVPVILHHTTVDFVSLNRAMKALYEDNSEIFEPLNNAIESLALSLSVDLRLLPQKKQIEEIVTVFVIMFELFNVAKVQLLDNALPSICLAASYLPLWAQARLASIWAKHCKANLPNFLEMLQHLITLQVISVNFYHDNFVQDNKVIVSATKVMKIVYYASILAGKLEPKVLDEDSKNLGILNDEDELYQYSSFKTGKSVPPEDPLAVELGVSALDSREPYIKFEEFYNETLSENIEMDKDYLNYKQMVDTTGKPFSFMYYSFVLTPATKTFSLYFDHRIRMYSERRISIFNTQIAGQPPSPYLRLKVRRDHLIDDALVELELVAIGNPKDFKKQLYVEFVGEQGVDEGGVSKEFFQLIIEEIFNPDYGMFIEQKDTNTFWFNATSFENHGQFTLIGIVLGLAIYNNIILPVSFPLVVYRKLMGLRGTFLDLEDINPTLFRSLKSMLEYTKSDMEDVFMQTFRIAYHDMFGTAIFHELKPNGDNILVNQDNKQEFVDLYSDFLLNQSIEKQFLSFRRGFQMVTDESPLNLLFRPEEMELLVCGTQQFDFNELEQATEYDGGYTAESQAIKDFWSIVHALPLELKKKLLAFTTGSDRAPVGGLAKLKLVIARNGPDCERLPTSHTCFNVLLLPEYSSKDKLEERLLKAINYSKGFGMI